MQKRAAFLVGLCMLFLVGTTGTVGAQEGPKGGGDPGGGAASGGAKGLPSGATWVVSLGDSYISGEAGRWAGNTSVPLGWWRIDAGGPTAYFDNPDHTAEVIPYCHRSTSAEIHIGAGVAGGVSSENLACSGAVTDSVYGPESLQSDKPNETDIPQGEMLWKPGIDFYNEGGRKGQALMLEEFARTNRVRMVVLSIGGNDFDFGPIVKECALGFLFTGNKCENSALAQQAFSPANILAVGNKIRWAHSNVRQAMANAGYTEDEWDLLVQTYPSPLPKADRIRYGETYAGRFIEGGCPIYNSDADWANDTALTTINNTVRNAVTQARADGATNVHLLDIQYLLEGRRLCETGVSLIEWTWLWDWRSQGASDQTEWVEQIRFFSTFVGPYFIQESLHPNWWGQLALRNCVRQAYNDGDPRGGVCRRGANGLNALGEPNTVLRPS